MSADQTTCSEWDDRGLSAKAMNVLAEAGWPSAAQVRQHGPRWLLARPHSGRRVVEEIAEAVGGWEEPQPPPPPIYDPKVDALSQQAWFRDAYAAVHQAVIELQVHGFKGTINVPGGSLHVR